jgi:branched-chain amino acid transport system ATP-binding protein
VTVRFDALIAVEDVHLALTSREILGLIGPNGAGKTTLVNVIAGAQRPTAGKVFLDTVDITRWPAYRRARSGLSRTFQGGRLFAGLSVIENAEASGVGGGLTRNQARRLGRDLLQRVGLESQMARAAASLPYGDERRLALVRALMHRPSLLLLDEPAAGLNEKESDELCELIESIRDDFHCGILLIDHDMRLVLNVCERIQVLDSGRTIAEGSPTSVARDPAVRTAYLGGAE